MVLNFVSPIDSIDRYVLGRLTGPRSSWALPRLFILTATSLCFVCLKKTLRFVKKRTFYPNAQRTSEGRSCGRRGGATEQKGRRDGAGEDGREDVQARRGGRRRVLVMSLWPRWTSCCSPPAPSPSPWQKKREFPLAIGGWVSFSSADCLIEFLKESSTSALHGSIHWELTPENFLLTRLVSVSLSPSKKVSTLPRTVS